MGVDLDHPAGMVGESCQDFDIPIRPDGQRIEGNLVVAKQMHKSREFFGREEVGPAAAVADVNDRAVELTTLRERFDRRLDQFH